MAEGDSIARLARRLDGSLAGRVVKRSWFGVPGVATTDLAGYRIVGVVSRGKHLLLRLEPPAGPRDRPRAAGGGGGLTLHLHLRMDGRLQVRRRAPHPTERTRLILDLGDGALVGEAVPVVEVVRTREEAAVIGHLGPDLCAAGWSDADAAEAARRLGARSGQPIIEALLDQRNLAGVGNLYAVEGCFVAGLWPWLPVGTLEGPRLARLVDLEHRMLAAGVAGSGQVTTGDRRPGRTHWVYGRKDRPCYRCATPIRFCPGDGGPATRPTWWCPHCQPGAPTPSA